MPDSEDEMARKAASITALKRFYNDRLARPTGAELEGELSGASDRSVIITLAAFLESGVEFILSKVLRRMTQKQFEEFFRHDGPVGSFSAKIQMAYGLKLIDEKVRDQLDIMREMRNACAHCKLPISFKTAQLQNVCKRVLHPNGTFRTKGADAKDFRQAFTAEAMYLYNVLISGREQAEQMVHAAYEKAGMQSPLRRQ